ncbi:MAG: hypothetical protein QXN93_04775, partial [Methanomassiliicoccales archaeon]
IIAGTGATMTSISTGNIIFLNDICAISNDKKPLRIKDYLKFELPGVFDRVDLDKIRPEICRMLSFLVPRLDGAGLAMMGDLQKKYLIPSNTGFTYSCELAQYFASQGNLEDISHGSVALLGLVGYSDFDPDLASRILMRTSGLSTKAFWTQMQDIGRRGEMHATEIAFLSRNTGFQESIAEAIKDIDCDTVGIPPIYPLQDYHKKMELLQKETGRRIFEVVTPLSLPGLRLQEAMESIARNEGVKLCPGLIATRLKTFGNRAESIVLKGKYIETEVKFRCLIASTGGMFGRAITNSDNGMRDILNAFEISNIDGLDDAVAQSRYRESIQIISRMGLRCDNMLRIFLRGGKVAENVFGAGSCLEGLSFASGYGLGTAFFTAWLSAMNAMEVL